MHIYTCLKRHASLWAWLWVSAYAMFLTKHCHCMYAMYTIVLRQMHVRTLAVHATSLVTVALKLPPAQCVKLGNNELYANCTFLVSILLLEVAGLESCLPNERSKFSDWRSQRRLLRCLVHNACSRGIWICFTVAHELRHILQYQYSMKVKPGYKHHYD